MLEENSFSFDLIKTMRKGHSFKDTICPDTFEFKSDYFKMGKKYGRVIFLKEYASYIKDNMVAELTDLNRNLMMSIDVVPIYSTFKLFLDCITFLIRSSCFK